MKLYISILLIIIGLSLSPISAKPFYCKSSLITIDLVDGNGYGKWMECESDIVVDFENRQITIYNTDTQTFNIEYCSLTEYKHYSVIGCFTADNNNKTCILKIFVYNDGNIYVKIEYNHIIYKYKVKRYNL